VVRLPTDLDALKSKNQETVSKLEAEKAVLQNKIEALEEQLGELEQLRLEDNKERHSELKLALKDLEQELSEREAFSDRVEALLSIAEDKFARSCLEVESLRQQISDIRTTEGLAAQASSSDHGLPSDTIARVVLPLPRNDGESEEDPEEQMLQHVLRECEQLEKLISDESAELQAEEDEFRKLDANHMALVKEYGDSFTWKAGKQKQGKTKG
jgi:phage shock protein A